MALEWGIKQSLVTYVIGMEDGSAAVSPPARVIRDGFRFPRLEPDPAAGAAALGDGVLRFSGSVRLSGHGGMLQLVVEDPWLVPGASDADPWALTIADAYEPGSRLPFATFARLDADDDGGATARGTRLTAEGADLFLAGPYSEGTELDDPRVVPRG